jgi:hypothetical protein
MLEELGKAGAAGEFRVLAHRAARHCAIDTIWGVVDLLKVLHKFQANEPITILARRAAEQADLGDIDVALHLVDVVEFVGATDQVPALAQRIAEDVELHELRLPALLGRLTSIGATKQFTLLAQRAIEHVDLDDVRSVAALLSILRSAGANQQFATLAHYIADRTDHTNLWTVDSLLHAMGPIGTIELLNDDVTGRIIALALDAVRQAGPSDLRAVDSLLRTLRSVGAPGQVTDEIADQITALARDAVEQADLTDFDAVDSLLNTLRSVSAAEQLINLAHAVAAHTPVSDPAQVAKILYGLRSASAIDSFQILARRASEQANLHDPAAVARLLVSLQEGETLDPAAILAGRADLYDYSSADGQHGHHTALRVLLSAGVRCFSRLKGLVLLCAADLSLDNPYNMAALIASSAESPDTLSLVAPVVATRVAVDDAAAVAVLLTGMHFAGRTDEATVLARRAAEHVVIDVPRHIYALFVSVDLIASRGFLIRPELDTETSSFDSTPHYTAMIDQTNALLAQRTADHIPLDKRGLPLLLSSMHRRGATAHALRLTRRAADHVLFDDGAVAGAMIAEVRAAGATELADELTKRVVDHVLLRQPANSESLLTGLGSAASPALTASANLLPAAGLFEWFLAIGDHRHRFRFGREPDGRAAARWTWDALE